MAEFPAPREGFVLTHFIVVEDVERSRRFYTEVLGGKAVMTGEPTIVALANGWIIMNVGGGPTVYKPTVILQTPPDPDRTSASSTSGWQYAEALAARHRELAAEKAQVEDDGPALELRQQDLTYVASSLSSCSVGLAAPEDGNGSRGRGAPALECP